jgi:uncharacterized protein
MSVDTTKPLYVVDTNTLISAALFSQSVPRQAVRKVLRKGQLLVSSATFNELTEVFRRDKFERYTTLAVRERILAFVADLSLRLEPTQQLKVCRDPKDDKFLELALAGSASCIITGDKDLLELHPFQDIPIVPAKVFLESS